MHFQKSAIYENMVLAPIKYVLNEARLNPVMLQKCIAAK